MKLNINFKMIIKVLLGIVLLLTAISILGQVYKFTIGYDRYIVSMFDLDSEKNFPTWYATISLFFCSFLLVVIGFVKKHSDDQFYINWITLSILFLVLSLDENVQLHEQTITPLRSLFNSSGIFYFAWVIPACFILIFLLLYFLKFLKNLPVKTRTLFIFAGTIFIIGSIGGELVGGYYQSMYQEKNMAYAVITNIEELFEMLGVLTFIYALFDYMNRHLNELKIQIYNK
jgi:hypothetical protein